MLHAAVLRSPHAARPDRVGRLRRRARALEGVHRRAHAAPSWPRSSTPMPRFCAEEVVEHAVAVDKVRYAGEAVAIAVAESRYLAEDALELVEIDYELLEPLVDPVDAADGRARRSLHENLGTERRLRADVHARRRRGRLRARRARRPPHAALAARRAPRRWSPPARSATSTRATGRMDVHSNSNMLNFAAWVLSGTLRMRARADRLPPDVHGRELRLQAPDGEGDRARGRDVQAHRAAR